MKISKRIIPNSFGLLVFLFLSPGLRAGEFTSPLLGQDESTWNGLGGRQFLLCRITSNGAKNSDQTLRLKVNFDEGSSVLKEGELKRLKKFFSQVQVRPKNVRFVAHTDQCGDPEFNFRLGEERAKSVFVEFYKKFKQQNVKLENQGESGSSEHLTHDRFVEVMIDVPSLKPESSFKKLVVIDSSGSFAKGRSRSGLLFSQIQKMKFDSDTVVFIARDPQYPCEGSDLANYQPIGDDYFLDAVGVLSTYLKGASEGVVYANGRQSISVEDETALTEAMSSLKGRAFLEWSIR